jgi:Protein of unknown function (DUF3892)
MSTRRRISCINKQDHPNPHEKILNIGGIFDGEGWKYSQARAVAFTERGVYSFYMTIGKSVIDVIVATHNGHKYLKTQPDASGNDNLLSLPECPLNKDSE